MKANWPWLVVYCLVQGGVFWLAGQGLMALGMPGAQREPLAGFIAFGALILVWVVESLLRERREALRSPAS